MTFDVGAYDPSRPLVIDPMVLNYSTYLGGPSSDYAHDIAVDKFGSAYITGQAGSGFPLVNPPQVYAGGGDAFVAKLSPNGQTLVYATYIGGSYEERGYGIAVDFKGSAYISGVTMSGNFPTTAGVFQPANGHGTCNGFVSCADAFITKLNPSGSALTDSTFLGVGSIESADAIAVDAAGNAYIKGRTNAPNYYILNAVQPVFGGGSCNGGYCYDAFVTKLNPTGSALVYSTYLGGNQAEGQFFGDGGSIALDPAGHAYVTGYTRSYNFPTYNPLQATKSNASDAFVTKLSPDGSAFVYSTYIGGTLGDTGSTIAADPSGNAFLTGTTYSDDFPTTPGAFKTAKTGGGSNGDAFICKIKSDGSAFIYSTLLGGDVPVVLDAQDGASGIAIDTSGNAYVTGTTYSADFPTQNAFQPAFAGGDRDGFVTKLNATGSALVYSSYLGGDGTGVQDDGNDSGTGIALDSFRNAYVTGTTHSMSFPTVKPYQAQSAGSNDTFITKVNRLGREPLHAEPITP